MEERLKHIIKKYWDESESYFSRYFYDKNDTEYDMYDELKSSFENHGVKHKIETIECYSSCGYDCDVLAVAWIENDKIYTKNILLECR